MALNNTTRSFQSLPYDVQFDVVTFLDFPSALNLAATNRYFHHIVNPRTNLPLKELEEFLLQRDCCERLKLDNLFACFKCFRFLPRHKFARSVTRHKLHWRGKEKPKQIDRTCFDCSARLRLFPHLRPISNGKLNYYFCHKCGVYKTKSAKCNGVSIDLGLEAPLPIAFCGSPAAKAKSQLESLPVHILRMVVSYLGYKDTINLTRANHTLRDTIEPLTWIPLHARFRDVRDSWHAGVLDVLEADYTAYPCYYCCQIRPKEKFTSMQVISAHRWPETMWKMRCIKCLQQISRGGKNPIRREHFRRRWCEICKCIKIGGETCGGCLELYVKGAIDLPTIFPKKAADAHRLDYEDHVHNYDGIFQEEDFMSDIEHTFFAT